MPDLRAPLPASSVAVPAPAFPRHFYSLDALRGLAALSVVFWHWQHFFFVGSNPGPDFQPQRQPWFAVLEPLYTTGWQAVDLFFCLSGFIFFWLYADKIGRRAISLRQFVVLRLSRLYPLHLATLLFAAAMQFGFLWRSGHFFVYQQNDLAHFALQLVLASEWGIVSGASFNGPVWSVSIEVLLYGVFFVLCFTGCRRWWQLLALVGAGYFELNHGSLSLGRGLLSFFMGGLTLRLCQYLVRSGFSRGLPFILAVGAALLWVVVPFFSHPEAVSAAYRASRWHVNWYVHGTDVLDWMFIRKYQTVPGLATQPLTVLALALWEVRRGTLGRRLAFLGQISYSSYLLHFPLQMVFAAVARGLALPATVFYSPASLLLFLAVLVPLSLASFHYFELPCQTWLRDRLMPAREQKV